MIAIDRAPAPVHGGVIDEPFHPNIIAKKTNTASVAGFGSVI